jgi:hypothetical protein
MDNSIVCETNFKFFLKKYLENEDDINFIFNFVNGTKNYIKYRKLLIFYGQGSNGKTTVIKYIQGLLDSIYITNYGDLQKSTNSIDKDKNLIIIDQSIKLPIIKEILFNDDIKGNLLTETNDTSQYIHRSMNDKIRIIEFKRVFDNKLEEDIILPPLKLQRTYKCYYCLIAYTLKDFSLYDKKGRPKCCKECENKLN